MYEYTCATTTSILCFALLLEIPAHRGLVALAQRDRRALPAGPVDGTEFSPNDMEKRHLPMRSTLFGRVEPGPSPPFG